MRMMDSSSRSVYVPAARGFTIVELLIVIVVIAVLAAISIVTYQGVQDRANNAAVKADLSNNAKKLLEYQTVHGRYPLTWQEFRASGVQFALNSHRYAVYCEKGGSAEPEFMIVSLSFGEDSYAVSSKTGLQPYDKVFSNPPSICAQAGMDTPTTSAWLRGNSGWTGWVVE